MYGQGYPPPVPPRQSGVPASVIVLRVVFAALPLVSLGLLAWATALRIALLTRRVVDWLLLALSVAVFVVGLVLMPEENDTSLGGDLIVGMVLLTAVAFTAYFLAVDIRLGGRRRPPAAPAPIPQPYNPYAATVPQHPYPQPGYGYGYPQAPVPAPAPAHPHPVTPPAAPAPRIDQVRAELDELSDLLRKDEGGR